jgi:para-aminobenzoate synthetase/4-amino-4-deoxychorismate lyase
MTPGSPWARFDDLRAGTAIVCPAPSRVLTAERPEEVVAVLAEVETATESGQWAYGYVTYEAAGGLDPDLAVHPPTPGGMPLAWFGLCGEPVAAAPLDAPLPPSQPKAPDAGRPAAMGASDEYTAV